MAAAGCAEQSGLRGGRSANERGKLLDTRIVRIEQARDVEPRLRAGTIAGAQECTARLQRRADAFVRGATVRVRPRFGGFVVPVDRRPREPEFVGDGFIGPFVWRKTSQQFDRSLGLPVGTQRPREQHAKREIARCLRPGCRGGGDGLGGALLCEPHLRAQCVGPAIGPLDHGLNVLIGAFDVATSQSRVAAMQPVCRVQRLEFDGAVVQRLRAGQVARAVDHLGRCILQRRVGGITRRSQPIGIRSATTSFVHSDCCAGKILLRAHGCQRNERSAEQFGGARIGAVLGYKLGETDSVVDASIVERLFRCATSVVDRNIGHRLTHGGDRWGRDGAGRGCR